MPGPDDEYPPAELDAMGEHFFRWRYCPQCKVELTTDEEVPPYAWVHDMTTGEHRHRPK
jgi:hypothetical protein